VSEGDTVKRDQPIVEVETEKASLEVPSTVAGTVTRIHVAAGDSVAIGATLVDVGDEADANLDPGADASPKPSRETPAEPATAGVPPVDRSAPATSGPDPGDAPAAAAAEPAQPPTREAVRERKLRDLGDPVPAAPSVRRLARELGLDIRTVSGSGPGGRISRSDVVRRAKEVVTSAGSGAAIQVAAGAGGEVPELPDFSSFGEFEREPLSALRRAAAQGLTRSWTQIPHVTQQDRADVTEQEAFRKRYAGLAERAGAKLTVTAMAIKVAAVALRRFPRFNASYDARSQELVLKKYVHVGVAADTERGLVVPVVRDADRKGVLEIAAEIGDLAARAREKKIQPDEMRGASFTISNLGGLGTTYFTPIVNWPEVAILGLGRAAVEPAWRDDGFEPRTILPLSLSYDHRVIDRRTWAWTSPWSTSKRTRGACACTAAASRRRRCCTSRS
jgi:pyruvate dehydrogenase E2 component (dihydrolipoamide acetyltransferase)